MMTQTPILKHPNVPLSLKKRLKDLATNLIAAVNNYVRKQGRLSENRQQNVNHLLTLLDLASKNPSLSIYKTPDALAADVYDYLSNPQLFVTGWFNGSSLRWEVFQVIQRDYPLVFVKATNDKNHYKQLMTDLEKMTKELEGTMVRVISYKNAIIASRATLAKVNDSMDKLNIIPKLDLKSPKQDLHDALVLQINQIGDLEERLKEDELKQAELEESIIFKSDAMKRLELQLKKAKDSEALAKSEAKQLREDKLQMSNSMFGRAQNNGQSCAVEITTKRRPEIAMTQIKPVNRH
jgi:hypothetical protein